MAGQLSEFSQFTVWSSPEGRLLLRDSFVSSGADRERSRTFCGKRRGPDDGQVHNFWRA